MSQMMIAKSTDKLANLSLLPALANRHGLITGATGTGKTVTLKVLAEQFSLQGVPVFLADAKGDLSGLAKAGTPSDKLQQRLDLLQIEQPNFQGFSTVFWDLFAKKGHPVRTTISEIGPILLSRILNLNPTQEGVLSAVFRIADDQALLLIDFKDLKAMLQFVSENASELKHEYGSLSPASIGAIQRNLLALGDQGGEDFFAEPGLDLMDFIQTDSNGLGQINILAADQLMTTPRLYASFLLWMLSELFEQLPEVGDLAKPKFVFFFDEAHLLFADKNLALQEKIEHVVRLIRSKGVGVYFITQNPADIPDKILGQLGNRIQHALRAFTPKDQKAIKAAAETFRSNPNFDSQQAITELAVGEALVSFLDQQGTPTMVERAWIMPPASQFPPLTAEEIKAQIAQSIVAGVYEKVIDRESAYELLERKIEQQAELKQQQADEAAQAKAQLEQDKLAKQQAKAEQQAAAKRAKLTQDVVSTFAKSAARTLGSRSGRSLVRGILGSLFK